MNWNHENKFSSFYTLSNIFSELPCCMFCVLDYCRYIYEIIVHENSLRTTVSICAYGMSTNNEIKHGYIIMCFWVVSHLVLENFIEQSWKFIESQFKFSMIGGWSSSLQPIKFLKHEKFQIEKLDAQLGCFVATQTKSDDASLQLTLLCSFVVGETIAKIIPHRPRLVTL